MAAGTNDFRDVHLGANHHLLGLSQQELVPIQGWLDKTEAFVRQVGWKGRAG